MEEVRGAGGRLIWICFTETTYLVSRIEGGLAGVKVQFLEWVGTTRRSMGRRPASSKMSGSGDGFLAGGATSATGRSTPATGAPVSPAVACALSADALASRAAARPAPGEPAGVPTFRLTTLSPTVGVVAAGRARGGFCVPAGEAFCLGQLPWRRRGRPNAATSPLVRAPRRPCSIRLRARRPLAHPPPHRHVPKPRPARPPGRARNNLASLASS